MAKEAQTGEANSAAAPVRWEEEEFSLLEVKAPAVMRIEPSILYVSILMRRAACHQTTILWPNIFKYMIVMYNSLAGSVLIWPKN